VSMAKNKKPKSYKDLSKDEKSLAHYLVEESSLEGLPKGEQEKILFKAWEDDQPGPLM
tara:strand:+ start:429 stop:602 length:174 start_codon:yes stop_codon:yes gene_type:complete